tara:strand:- start:206 stop:568 length:363 start_codon:yes stop_codon:yes gene_type:complete
MKIVRYQEVPDEVRGGGLYVIKRLITENITQNPKNIGFYQTTIPKGSKVPGHHHAKLDEVFIFLTKARVEIEGSMYHFHPKDMVFLKAGDKHEIFADDEDVVLIAIKLPDHKEDKVLYNE